MDLLRVELSQISPDNTQMRSTVGVRCIPSWSDSMCAGTPGKLLFELSLVLRGKRSRSLGVLRGNGVDVVAKTTGWWKVRQ